MTTKTSKVNIERFRWTEEERYDIFKQLRDNLRPKPKQESRLIMALDTLEVAKTLRASAGELVGLSTGYPSLDKMTKGIAPGDLTIVFGDTSHGKSQLTQNIAWNLAREGTPVMFIGLEMTNAQNTTRFMSIADARGDTYDSLANIIYPEDNDLNYSSIEVHISEAVEVGAALIVIDQLQQLTRSVDNTANETSLITHEIKRMAVKYQVPIILISHINRTGNTGSAPTLRELKGSSSIEQDADMCVAVWRDMDPRHEKSHIVEIWLRKNRNRGMEYSQADFNVRDGVLLEEMFQDSAGVLLR